jgi:hypothetical protein
MEICIRSHEDLYCVFYVFWRSGSDLLYLERWSWRFVFVLIKFCIVFFRSSVVVDLICNTWKAGHGDLYSFS